jgi:hypothetical protein
MKEWLHVSKYWSLLNLMEMWDKESADVRLREREERRQGSREIRKWEK